jgi:tropinone reductase I
MPTQKRTPLCICSTPLHYSIDTMIKILLSLVLLFHCALCVCGNGWSFPSQATAVVTGGTKGIGRAVVSELAGTHRCRVLTCSRNTEELQSCVEEWRALGYDVQGVVADVATADGRSKLIDDIRSFLTGEKLDILVNNVGTNIRKPSIEYSQEEVDFVWQTNFASMFGLTIGCHEFLKREKGEGTSSVVNIGSVAGVTCVKTGTPYAATKAAMNQVTGNWACEWGPDGIRVNCVTPWYINTVS